MERDRRKSFKATTSFISKLMNQCYMYKEPAGSSLYLPGNMYITKYLDSISVSQENENVKTNAKTFLNNLFLLLPT